MNWTRGAFVALVAVLLLALGFQPASVATALSQSDLTHGYTYDMLDTRVVACDVTADLAPPGCPIQRSDGASDRAPLSSPLTRAGGNPGPRTYAYDGTGLLVHVDNTANVTCYPVQVHGGTLSVPSWHVAANSGVGLADDVAKTFKGGRGRSDDTSRRPHASSLLGGGSQPVGQFWVQTAYSSPGRAKQYLALPPSDTATTVTTIRVPTGTIIFSGNAAAQQQWSALGGGNHVYIPRVDPAWIVP